MVSAACSMVATLVVVLGPVLFVVWRDSRRAKVGHASVPSQESPDGN